MNREYTNAYGSTFIIYKDRVEAKNANRPHLLGNLVPGNFEPYSKNPNLAKFFVQMARAEDLGTGINNVYAFLKPYAGTVPEFNEEQLFKVIVPLSMKIENSIDELNDPLNDPLNKRQQLLIKLIKDNSRITVVELAEKCNVGRETIKRDLIKLQDMKLISRVGSKKTGSWYVL